MDIYVQSFNPEGSLNVGHLPGLKDSTDSWHILTWGTEGENVGTPQTGDQPQGSRLRWGNGYPLVFFFEWGK